MTQKRWTIAFAPAGEGLYQVTVRRSGAVHRFTTRLPPDISELWAKSDSVDTQNRSFRKSPEGVPNEAMFFQAANLPTLKEIGERVLNSVFDVAESMEGPKIIGALEDRIADSEGVEIEIDLSQTAELSGIPWESLYLRSRDRFLAIGTTSNIVRRLDAQSEPPKPIERPIRILVAAANPHKDLDTGEELANIRKRIDCLVAEGDDDFEIRELPSATRNDFMREVNDWQPHVVHYIGHSSFREGSGYLYFESSDEDESDAVSAETLRNMLLNRRPWLVVLNSCRSGETSRDDPMGGVAQNLLQRLNIPFVVAMQQPVSDDAAIRFSQEFYTALTGGEKIADAVTMGRCAIANDRDERTQVELITPALYTSGDSDRIAFVETPAAAVTANMGDASADVVVGPLSTFLRTRTGKVASALVALPLVLAAGFGVWKLVEPAPRVIDPDITGPDSRGDQIIGGLAGGPKDSDVVPVDADDLDPTGNPIGRGGDDQESGLPDEGGIAWGDEGEGAPAENGHSATQQNSSQSGGANSRLGRRTGATRGDASRQRTGSTQMQARRVVGGTVPRTVETPARTGGAVHVSEQGIEQDSGIDPAQPREMPAVPTSPYVDPVETPPTENVENPPVAPPPPPPPPVCENPALIFFDWDSSTPPQADALQVVDFVAANAVICNWTDVTVIGHADASGPNGYNLGLSERRAENVAAMLRQVAGEIAISVEYRGEEDPRVPTENGVREIQNRRVEIRVN